MKPGAEFTYCSCTHFPNDYGTMEGDFTFRVFQTGLKLNIDISTVFLATNPYFLAFF